MLPTKVTYPIDVPAYIGTLCNVRDSLREMLKPTYKGSYDVLKPIPGSTSQYLCRDRKTTLTEARKRIELALPKLNQVIDLLAKFEFNP